MKINQSANISYYYYPHVKLCNKIYVITYIICEILSNKMNS